MSGLKKSKLNTKLNEKIIDNLNDWKSKHIKTIKQSYASHQYAADLNELTDFLQGLDSKIISELNISLIKFIASRLKIGGNFINSSQINVDKKRTDKIIAILTNLKATNYFSPLGAKEYLNKDNFSILEIGVLGGGSLNLWRDYFFKKCLKSMMELLKSNHQQEIQVAEQKSVFILKTLLLILLAHVLG